MRMSVIEWLLDSDPSIRWQVMRDLNGEPDATVARERSRIAGEGWGLACWTFKDRMAIGAARRSSRTPGPRPWTRSSCGGISALIRRHLWGLDYLRRAGSAPDHRIAEAVDLVARTPTGDGRSRIRIPGPV